MISKLIEDYVSIVCIPLLIGCIDVQHICGDGLGNFQWWLKLSSHDKSACDWVYLLISACDSMHVIETWIAHLCFGKWSSEIERYTYWSQSTYSVTQGTMLCVDVARSNHWAHSTSKAKQKKGEQGERRQVGVRCTPMNGKPINCLHHDTPKTHNPLSR